MTTDTCKHGLPPENCADCRGVTRICIANADEYERLERFEAKMSKALSPDDFGAIKYRQEIRRRAVYLTPEQLEELMVDIETLINLFDAANN